MYEDTTDVSGLYLEPTISYLQTLWIRFIYDNPNCKNLRTPGGGMSRRADIVFLNVASSTAELIHEVLVELGNTADPVGARSQESRPEMKSTLLLTKARARNHTDTGRVEKTRAVELIGLATLLRSRLHCLGRQGNRGEEVHGALGRNGQKGELSLQLVIEDLR
jgi:hypothetical protein